MIDATRGKPLVRYLCFALMMTARLPAGDPVRRSAERNLLQRLSSELRYDDTESTFTWRGDEAESK